MTYAADRKAETYSRGMKQRLGIADVLMKDPKIIIMDEPTLGIDPEGMRELMALIRELSEKDGRTILISSHQLYQVQQICDRVGIFVQDRLIACGDIEELGRQLENEGLYTLDLRMEPMDETVQAALAELEGVRNVTKTTEGSLQVESDRDIRRAVTRLAAERDYIIQQLHQRGGDLDEIYRRYFEKAGEQDDSGKTGKMDAERIRRILRRNKKADQ